MTEETSLNDRGNLFECHFSALLMIKAFKNLKNPTLKKNLWVSQFFFMAKIVKINRKNQTLWSP
jgi:hypothetical protein